MKLIFLTLQSKISDYGAEVIINVLGFNSNHNDQFLESLSLLGTSDGSYNFIDENTSEIALEKRLCELVEGATGLVGQSAYVALTFDKESGHMFLGDWFGKDHGLTELTLHVS